MIGLKSSFFYLYSVEEFVSIVSEWNNLWFTGLSCLQYTNTIAYLKCFLSRLMKNGEKCLGFCVYVDAATAVEFILLLFPCVLPEIFWGVFLDVASFMFPFHTVVFLFYQNHNQHNHLRFIGLFFLDSANIMIYLNFKHNSERNFASILACWFFYTISTCCAFGDICFDQKKS